MSQPPEFSPEQRQALLRIAHESILSAFAERAMPQAPLFPCLSELRGAFTTLHLHGNLRGCVGYATPVVPLYKAVAETARAAAFDDSRFNPVTKQEIAELRISLSVLSRLFPVRPEEVTVGRHGLVISLGSNRGCDRCGPGLTKPGRAALPCRPGCRSRHRSAFRHHDRRGGHQRPRAHRRDPPD